MLEGTLAVESPRREGNSVRAEIPLRSETRIHSAIVRDLPTGTVTFLFADIEGSTALQQNPRVDYAAAVALLRRLLRETVAAHGGAEADAVGDEYVAAFADPVAGADAAFATQRALRDTEWPDGATVRVRIGLHVGSPSLGEEGYTGSTSFARRGSRTPDTAGRSSCRTSC